MSQFKKFQVVRTIAAARKPNGHFVKFGTRMVVIKETEGGVVTAQYGKTKHERIKAPVSAFTKTFRGRPLGSTKKVVAPVVAVADVMGDPTPTDLVS